MNLVRMVRKASLSSTSRQKYSVRAPSGFSGLPLPVPSPWLNGKKVVLAPFRSVVIETSLSVTTKCTKARLPQASRTSLPSAPGLRSFLYCTCPRTTDWVNSVFNSMVATGMPLQNSTRSMDLFGFVIE